MKCKKIIIINWKWTWFHDDHVTDAYLSKPENQYLLTNIKRGKNKCFEIYPVANSGETTNAIVVATSIYQGDTTKDVLYNLIRHIKKEYGAENGEIYVFLHRGNFYAGDDVFQLLTELGDSVQNCFLFTDGRDYIYYDVKKEGFLDSAGGFKRARQADGKKIVVAKRIVEPIDDITTRFEIQQPYFDNVWKYYQFEFHMKIDKLKNDFLTWLVQYSPNEYPLEKVQFVNNLKKADGLLYIRLKSFLGIYDNLTEKIQLEENGFETFIELRDEREKLQQFEKENHTSYILDDCNANLINVHPNDDNDRKAHDCYLELKNLLSPIILHPDEGEVLHKDILEIRRFFSDLTQVLPSSLP